MALAKRGFLRENHHWGAGGSREARSEMDRDRNLLFGLFAVQLMKVTPSELVESAGA